MSEPSPYRQSANGAKPAVVQSAVMKQPNTQQLRALRLSALARDNKVVNAIRSSITQAPDALVKELMDVHGWPAHEALCAVQQLQQDVCLLYTSPSPRDVEESRMPSSA